ncbi:MAG: hypothetical protein CMJ58_12490 [Planctomycetaceae bacterium]|nr:hypothetical protein [Planctomycetaceae bacterium]
MGEFRDELTGFMSTFLGYGSLSASTWFIGPEEGGGQSVEELEKRIAVWQALGKRPTVDLCEFHIRLGVTKYFASRPTIQRTWGQLVRVHLAASGKATNTRVVRTYQAERLGRADGDSLLGELLPLPKSSLRAWPYAPLASSIACLRTQEAYRDELQPQRIELWQNMLTRYRPETVVFYGTNQKALWESIAGVRFDTRHGDFNTGSNDWTQFMLLKHPNARKGVDNSYFITAGSYLAELLR